MGDKVSATAEGFVIYEEYDKSDRKNYYWEEWELRGFNNYDSWIEYDHYSQKITLYEPLRPNLPLDPTQLTVGQAVSYETSRAGVITGTVKESSVGKVVRREGTLTYHVFEGEDVFFAEIQGTDGAIYSFEKYNEKEFDLYKGTILSKKDQKRILGKVVTPIKVKPSTAIYTLIFLFIFIPTLVPESISGAKYSTYCTPKSVTSTPKNSTYSPPTSSNAINSQNGDEIVSDDSKQTCYRRKIIGGTSSGGGLGK